MSIDDLTGGTNNQLPDGTNHPVSATSNKISDSIGDIDNLPGFEKFKNMLTLQPAIAGHRIDTEIEGKQIYAHLQKFKDYLLSREFVDRVSKINGTFENFVNKLELLKPQIDRVSVGSEGVVDGSKMNDLITEQSYSDFKNMYNSLRGLFKGIINPANGKADADRMSITLLVAMKGLPMLGTQILSKRENGVDIFQPLKVGRYGIFAISPYIDNPSKGLSLGTTVDKKYQERPIHQTILTETNIDILKQNNTDLSGQDKLTKEAVRYITYEIGAVKGDIICSVITTHYSSGSGAILRMK